MIDRKWIGQTYQSEPMTVTRDRLRLFAKAIGSRDPIYRDSAAAKAAGYQDIPVPTTFLVAAELDDGATEKMLADLQVPMGRILHGEQGFTYHAPVTVGDTLTVKARIDDIYDKKNGAIEFIVRRSDVFNQTGARVAELRSVIVVRH
nr:MaoC family dehydratase N-terminal domain-containing protein [uncultured Pseudomonas sp.]